jgi:hypothetical protein
MARSRLISKVSEEAETRTLAQNSGSELLTFIHFDVHRPPPNIIFAGVLIDDTLVFGASSSLLPRKVDERAGRGDDGAFVPDGILVQLSNWRIAFEIDLVHVKASLREIVEVAADHCEFMVSLFAGARERDGLTVAERLGVVCLCIVLVENMRGDIGSLENHDV